MIFIILTLITCIIFTEDYNDKPTIGICITATGKYITLALPLIESARIYLCPEHKKTFYLFTDAIIDLPEDVVVIPAKKYGWPFDSMFRFMFYLKNKELFEHNDYMIAIDADMLFVDYVGTEILQPLVGSEHSLFTKKRGSFEEKNKKSKAYIAPHEGRCYFHATFYGGQTKRFISLLEVCSNYVAQDVKNKCIPIWHDESHLNRYFEDNPPVHLSPAYCYLDFCGLDIKPKIIGVPKDIHTIRK